MPTPEEIKAKIQAKKGSQTSDNKKADKSPTPKEKTSTGRNFIIITRDFSGLGFALQQLREHPDSQIIMATNPSNKLSDTEKESFAIIGKGLVERMKLSDIMEKRNDYKDWYWVADSNHSVEERTLLEDEGFKIFGDAEFGDKCEHDRSWGLNFAEENGLSSPPFQEFTNWQEGVKFLEENELDAYVFKPDDDTSDIRTTVPVSPEPQKANLEMRNFLAALQPQNYLLQKRIQGIEINVESWWQNGEMVFSFANFECKRYGEHDLGRMCGCSQDVGWVVENDSKLVEMSTAKFNSYFSDKNYTGFFDVNIIINGDDVYLLEFCGGRFGYNSHPGLSQTLLKKTMLETVADLVDGVFVNDAKRGFGATLTLFSQEPKKGFPIYIPEGEEQNVYLFDAFKKEQLCMSGFGEEIAIVSMYNHNISFAFEDAIALSERIKFNNIYFRKDGAKVDYALSAVRRFEGLVAWKLL